MGKVSGREAELFSTQTSKLSVYNGEVGPLQVSTGTQLKTPFKSETKSHLQVA